jgi:hypothetical protein
MITLLERQSRATQVTLIRILVALGVVLLIENLALLSLFKDAAPPAMMLVANQIPVSPFLPSLSTTEEEGREHILSIFEEAGVSLDDSQKAQLPSWNQVQDVVGEHPYIVGLEKCKEFRDKVPAVERMLGPAGMFNTGTNLVTHLLKGNCQIPERVEKYGKKATREQWGMRWQVSIVLFRRNSDSCRFPRSHVLSFCFLLFFLSSLLLSPFLLGRSVGENIRLPSFDWRMRR